MAVDDIVVHEGACLPEKDLCNFESEGLCEYTLSGDFAWSKGNGSYLGTVSGVNITDVR